MLNHANLRNTKASDLFDGPGFSPRPEITLTPTPSLYPHTEVTPQFFIYLGTRRVGYISRGHSFLIPEMRGKGVFPVALNKLEQFEGKLFETGKFKKYIQDLLEGIGPSAGQAEHVLHTLRTPHHIDYWRYPAEAAKFLKYGYSLDPYSLRQMRHMGMIGEDCNQDTLAAAMVKNADIVKNTTVCILIKKAEN